MPLKRIVRILKANLSTGAKPVFDADFEKRFQEAMKGKEKAENERQEPKDMDPKALKEAEYLANLELKQGATFEEIKSAYKTLVKKYHPDKFAGESEKQKFAEMVTRQLNEAFAYFEKKHGKS